MGSTAAGTNAPRVAAQSILERWAPAAGSLFAALLVAAVIVGSVGLGDVGNNVTEITRNFQTADYQSTGGLILILVMLSALCFLWFLADIAATIRSLSPGMLSSLVQIGGAVFISAFVPATIIVISPLLNIGHSQLEGGDPKTIATIYVELNEIAFFLFGFAGIAGALLMSAAARVANRSGLLPHWGAVVVVVGAVVTALTTWMLVLPIFLVVLWVFAASVWRMILSRRGVLAPIA